MAGCDFWRLPPDTAELESSGDELEEVPAVALKETATLTTDVASSTREESIALLANAVAASCEAAPIANSTGPTVAWQYESAATAPEAAHQEPLCWHRSSVEGCIPPELEELLGLDESMLAGCNFPVNLLSLASYLGSLTLDDPRAEVASVRGELPVASRALARTWLGAQLTRDCGVEVVTPELRPSMSDATGAAAIAGEATCRSSLHVGRTEVLRWGSGCSDPAAHGVLDDAKAAAASVEVPRAGWRVLYNGSVGKPESTVCGPIRAVPQLPNPLTILTDVPVLIEQMLADVPQGEWDAKQFWAPEPVAGFPGLCRGPGGLLPAYTPRQLAQNEIAAALLNRLCANLLTATATCSTSSKASQGSCLSPAQNAVAVARERLEEAMEAVRQADAEATKARADLHASQASSPPDMDEVRQMENIVGWKSSVATQAANELHDCQKSLATAEESLGDREPRKRATPWHETWSNLVPAEASAEQLFGVRLTTRGQVNFTVKDFIQAMLTGQHDRLAGGYVQKHALEAAFVRHVADPLLLCTRKGDRPEAAEVYTHLPSAAITGCGITDPKSGCELRTPRPNHAFLLRMEGQTFAFSVCLCASSGGALGFVGLGARALTYSTPWNPLEYGDVLWAQEAQETLSILPVVVTLANLVADPVINLGPFPPARGCPEVPLVVTGLALLQTALFNDLKMWPVALPESARLRWDYALRALRHTLGHRAEDDLSQIDVGLVRNEVVPRCLEVLPKVPNDDGLSYATGGGASGGFIDRLKRMEMSALTQAPFKSASTFRTALEELLELWPQFVEETSTA